MVDNENFNNYYRFSINWNNCKGKKNENEREDIRDTFPETFKDIMKRSNKKKDYDSYKGFENEYWLYLGEIYQLNSDKSYCVHIFFEYENTD